MESINRELQDYFIKMAPDFSVFDMVEKYYYDNNDFNGYENMFFFTAETSTSIVTQINRGMFLVHSDGTLSVENASLDEYTVFAYGADKQIVIAIQDTPITILSDDDIFLAIGVAF